MQRKFTALLIAVSFAFAILCGAGCIGPADAFVILPELTLAGQLVDAEGDAIAGRDMRISLAFNITDIDKIKEQIFLEDFHTHALDNKRAIYSPTYNAQAQTDETGHFQVKAPARYRNHPGAAVGFFVISPGGKRDLHIAIRAGEDQNEAYFILVHGKSAKVRRLFRDAETDAIRKERPEPGQIDVQLKRSKRADKVSVRLAESHGGEK